MTACRRTNAHTPHDGCQGTAPEFPSEKIEQVASAPRSLQSIAIEIAVSWEHPYFGAEPYIEAMYHLDKITDRFGQEGADDIVMHFLVNAKTWRGETARRVKAELKAMLP